MDWTPEELQAIVDEHALVLFMKGTPDQAQCGFSNRAAQVMQALGEPFAGSTFSPTHEPFRAFAPGRTSQPCLRSSFMEN